VFITIYGSEWISHRPRSYEFLCSKLATDFTGKPLKIVVLETEAYWSAYLQNQSV